MAEFIISIAVFALAMLGMAVGFIVTKKGMRHSCCGGELCENADPHLDSPCEHDEPCDDCPRRQASGDSTIHVRVN